MSESNDDGSVKSRGTKQEASSSAHKSAPKKEGVASSPSDKVIVQKPTEFDVLFGRGKPYQDHSGNLRLHSIVNHYKESYLNARRHEKTAIAEEVVTIIKDNGNSVGRFLKRNEEKGRWEEVDDNVARAKVSHALRGKSAARESTSRIVLKSKAGLRDSSSKGDDKSEGLPQVPPLESSLFAQHQNSMASPFNTATTAAGAAFSSHQQSMVPGLPLTYQSLLLSNIRAEREQLILQQLAAGALHPSQMAAALRQPPSSYFQNASRLLEVLRTNQNPNDSRGGPNPNQDPTRGP